MSKIINLGIVAHVDAGKTTITEQLLFAAGAIRTAGNVDDGTAHTDFMEIEKRRGISVKAASTVLSWQDCDINLIDTPGHTDFAAEVERSVWVVDCVVFVVSAVEGIQAQTEVIWKALKNLKKPVIFFINKTDRAGANPEKVFADIKNNFTKNIEFFDDRQKITEAVCEKNDALLEKYLDGTITKQETDEELKKQFAYCEIYPVLKGSAISGAGIPELLDLLCFICPDSNLTNEKNGEVSGVIFRIEHDKKSGRLAHVRLYSGSIKNRDTIRNKTSGLDEKIVQIRKNKLQKTIDAGFLTAGDIGIICGFSNAKLGDIIGAGKNIPPSYKIAAPLLRAKITPDDNGKYPELAAAISELSAEDPLLEMYWEPAERELIINVTGLIQIEILENMLAERFNLSVKFSQPSVIYKETPAKPGYGFEAYTMPKPCWAIIKFFIEPGERGSGYVYKSKVGDNKILYRYQSQIEQAIPGSLRQGLYGWEVTDLKITLVDGESHFIHTHPLDFINTTPMAFMRGLADCGTTLLEPMLDFRITADESLSSRIIGEIIAMRGAFDSPSIINGSFTVEGRYPASTSIDFPIRLASMTSGRGTLSAAFSGYEPCPLELGATTPYRGINPLDREKYILWFRGAITL
jgi:ribosomal protection tetracycline resistance protein